MGSSPICVFDVLFLHSVHQAQGHRLEGSGHVLRGRRYGKAASHLWRAHRVRLILRPSTWRRHAQGGDHALATAEVRGQVRKKQVKSIQVFQKYDIKVVISTSVSPTQIKSNPTNTNKTIRMCLVPEEQSFVLTLRSHRYGRAHP
jgi:hypothetical protein